MICCPTCGHELERSKKSAAAIIRSLQLSFKRQLVADVLLQNYGALVTDRAIAADISTERKCVSNRVLYIRERLFGTGLRIAGRKGVRRLCWEKRA